MAVVRIPGAPGDQRISFGGDAYAVCFGVRGCIASISSALAWTALAVYVVPRPGSGWIRVVVIVVGVHRYAPHVAVIDGPDWPPRISVSEAMAARQAKRTRRR